MSKFLVLGMIFTMAISCGRSESNKPNQRKKKSPPVQVSDDVLGELPGSQPRSKKSPTDQGEQFADDDTTITRADTGDNDALEQILEECGVAGIDDPDTQVLNQTLEMVVNTMQVSSIDVTLSGELVITSTMRDASTSSSADLTSDPAWVALLAQGQIDKKTGTVATEGFDIEGRSELRNDHDDWDGILCVVMPAKRSTDNRGERHVVVEYDPALPHSISPKAKLSRHEKELATARSFSVTATVLESNDDDYPVGSEYEGTATISPISPQVTFEGDDGQIHTVDAKAAYQVDVNFTDAKTTDGLGARPRTKYYLNPDHGEFEAIYNDPRQLLSPVNIFVRK